jgi:hypothetical protein
MAIINKTGITNGGTIQAEHITRVIDALSGVSTDTIIVSGSMTGSLIGSLTGTASFATSASRAVTSSFATTASFALNAGGTGFPFVGVARITGSLIVSGSNNDLTVNTRNTTITTIDNINIDSTSLNINANTEIIGRAGGTEWTATKYSVLDWREAGQSGFDGQLNLPLYAPTNPNSGACYFDTSTRSLFIYDGSTWKEFTPAP